MAVLLVRHAHALSRAGWDDDDSRRGLCDRGRKQAQGLIEVLRPYRPSRLLSSPFVRCLQTVEPLALALGMTVEAVGALAEGAGPSAVQLVRSMTETAVLCSHGDVIPHILVTLVNEDQLDVGRRPRNEKASVWVLESSQNRFTTATYLRPPDRVKSG
jgi:8-oxo-dGTP diphosphatase